MLIDLLCLEDSQIAIRCLNIVTSIKGFHPFIYGKTYILSLTLITPPAK